MEEVISPNGILEIIGCIIAIAVILGVIGTAIWIFIIALRADPDHEDQEDEEIYEHDYWKNKNKKA